MQLGDKKDREIKRNRDVDSKAGRYIETKKGREGGRSFF